MIHNKLVTCANLSFVIVLCLTLYSCKRPERPIDRAELIGEYSLKLPSGQVEVWRLGGDGSFSQKLFRDESALIKNLPAISTFESRWSLKDGRLWVEQTMDFFSLFPPFKMNDMEAEAPNNWGSPITWLRNGYGVNAPLIITSDDEGVFYVKSTGNVPNPRMVGWHLR